MPELVACQSAPAQAVRLAWARRLRRLTPLPWPIPPGLRERALARSVSRTSRQWRAARWFYEWTRGIRRCSVRAIDAIPCSRSCSRRRDCASCPFGRRLSSPCLVHDHVVERAVEDRAGKSGGRLRLDATLETAEDGHVAGLQVRSAVQRDEAQHDVWERRPHGGHGGLAGVDAGHVPEKDPRLSFLARVHHVVQGRRELQVRRRGSPAVL